MVVSITILGVSGGGHRSLGTAPRAAGSAGLGWDLRICISKILSMLAAAVGQRTDQVQGLSPGGSLDSGTNIHISIVCGRCLLNGECPSRKLLVLLS